MVSTSRIDIHVTTSTFEDEVEQIQCCGRPLKRGPLGVLFDELAFLSSPLWVKIAPLGTSHFLFPFPRARVQIRECRTIKHESTAWPIPFPFILLPSASARIEAILPIFIVLGAATTADTTGGIGPPFLGGLLLGGLLLGGLGSLLLGGLGSLLLGGLGSLLLRAGRSPVPLFSPGPLFCPGLRLPLRPLIGGPLPAGVSSEVPPSMFSGVALGFCHRL